MGSSVPRAAQGDDHRAVDRRGQEKWTGLVLGPVMLGGAGTCSLQGETCSLSAEWHTSICLPKESKRPDGGSCIVFSLGVIALGQLAGTEAFTSDKALPHPRTVLEALGGEAASFSFLAVLWASAGTCLERVLRHRPSLPRFRAILSMGVCSHLARVSTCSAFAEKFGVLHLVSACLLWHEHSTLWGPFPWTLYSLAML